MNKPNPLFEYLKLRRETVAYVEELKKEAQRTKCAVGQTKNPFKAVPGLETEFEKAVKTIRYCDNILNEIEKNRERKLRLRRAAYFLEETVVALVALVMCVGLIGAVCFGLNFIFAVIDIPLWAVLLALAAGSLLAVGWSWK